MASDWFNRIKESTKRRLGPLYGWGIAWISPVYTGYTNRRIREFLAAFDREHQMVVDLGSGPLRHAPDLLCCDGVGYDNVDLVADLAALPVASGSLDGIISIAVLEHVPEPQAHVAEMARLLKPGGRVLCLIPFLQGYHASPYDYQRFTVSGLRHLFRQFDIVGVEPADGPTSALVWALQEWLAMLLSFGSRRLYRLVLPLTYVLSPLKLLDALLRRHPMAVNSVSGILIEARRRA